MWRDNTDGSAVGSGSMGGQVEFDPVDTTGEIGVGMDADSCGCVGQVWAYLGVDERRELIKWLRANTPMEDENEQHAASPGGDAPGLARDETAGPTVDARPEA